MKKIFLLISISLLLWSCNEAKTTAPEMTKHVIEQYITKVADWQLKNPDTKKIAKFSIPLTDWAYAPYLNGLFAVSKIKGFEHYQKELIKMGDELKWEPIRTIFPANDHATPQTWVEIFEITGDTAQILPTIAYVDQFITKSDTSDLELTFVKKNFHKWSWCDALYMSPPLFARLAKVTGDDKYNEYLHKWWRRVSNFYYDTDEHLYYRDAVEMSRKEPNGKPVFWSRGEGWVVGGLVRVLEYLPETDPVRPMYISELTEMCEKLAAVQQPNGLWAAGVLDPDTWTKPETSGSGLILYAIAYAINEGIIDHDKYIGVIEKGWPALCKFVKEDGKFTGVQPIGDKPVKYDDEYTLPYGSGAFLLAASEIYKLAK